MAHCQLYGSRDHELAVGVFRDGVAGQVEVLGEADFPAVLPVKLRSRGCELGFIHAHNHTRMVASVYTIARSMCVFALTDVTTRESVGSQQEDGKCLSGKQMALRLRRK